ncbi:hypothetical protein [Rhodohalobacter sp. 8-1]|uniref:hypothetical protein n=1 Tax=Rhodohalobacter sp. 8-1 TaxID=3131972 RepID=UPI0030EBB919
MANVSHKNQGHHPRTLYLHIGIPKTASTWLQTNVFSKLDHLQFLDCSKNTMFQDIPDLSAKQRSLGNIFSSSIHIWEKFGDTIFEGLIGDRQAWLKNDQDLLISDERIGRQGSRPALLAAHLRYIKRKAFNWSFVASQNYLCIPPARPLAPHNRRVPARPTAGSPAPAARTVCSPHS